MKLLLYKWSANNEGIFRENLEKQGHEVFECTQKCNNYTADVELAANMIGTIHEKHIEGIVSYNYIPIISMAADAAGIKYFSWVQDNPHFTLLAKTTGLKCNRIGIFDRGMVETLRSRGINTVFHLPLASDAEKWQRTIDHADKAEKVRYSCDVSFVGSLYTGEHDYFDMIFGDDTDMKILEDQCFDYDDSVSFLAALNDSGYMDIAAEKMSELGLMLGPDYSYHPEDILLPSVFEKKVTILERDRLLRDVAKTEGIDFRLYTNSKTDIKNRGTVDYATKMPLVFNKSRINLNISLRSIHSGIPLRVIDIMACGGFALSNYQKEIAELFEEDKEVVMFRSKEEAIEKIKYYLDHEDERSAIARAGYEAAKERFSYSKGIAQLIV